MTLGVACLWLMTSLGVGAILSGLFGALRGVRELRRNEERLVALDRRYIERGKEGTRSFRLDFVNRRRLREGRPPLE